MFVPHVPLLGKRCVSVLPVLVRKYLEDRSSARQEQQEHGLEPAQNNKRRTRRRRRRARGATVPPAEDIGARRRGRGGDKRGNVVRMKYEEKKKIESHKSCAFLLLLVFVRYFATRVGERSELCARFVFLETHEKQKTGRQNTVQNERRMPSAAPPKKNKSRQRTTTTLLPLDTKLNIIPQLALSSVVYFCNLLFILVHRENVNTPCSASKKL